MTLFPCGETLSAVQLEGSTPAQCPTVAPRPLRAAAMRHITRGTVRPPVTHRNAEPRAWSHEKKLAVAVSDFDPTGSPPN
jgi:hypothetical protein